MVDNRLTSTGAHQISEPSTVASFNVYLGAMGPSPVSQLQTDSDLQLSFFFDVVFGKIALR